MGRPSIEKQNIVNCLLIDEGKKITFWHGEEFDKEIYNNSGILKPEVFGFIRYIIFPGYIELKQIFVRPEARRGGYGKLLVMRLIKMSGKIVTISNTTRGEVFGDFLIRMGFTEDIHKHWILKK